MGWKGRFFLGFVLLTTQALDFYGTAAAYQGPVRILHGTRDGIVPMWCSEKFNDTYTGPVELIPVEGGNHMITRKKSTFITLSAAFFQERLLPSGR